MVLVLPRLPSNWQAEPQLFEGYWNRAMSQIEILLNQITAIPAIQTAITAAQTAATNAQTAANTAQTAANTAQTAANTANTAAGNASTAATVANTAATTAQKNTNLGNSGVTGCTITATDAGSNCTVTISAHTRVYGNGTTVSVNSGTLTGLLYSTLYYFYYDNSTLTGGAVTYVSTTSSVTAAQLFPRHLVGSVTTPAALGSPATGKRLNLNGLDRLV